MEEEQSSYGDDDIVITPQESTDAVENRTWPLLRHSAFVAIVVILCVFLAVAITALGLASHKYFRSVQRKREFEQLDVTLVLPNLPKHDGGTGTATFSDACFSCTVEVTRDGDYAPLPGVNPVWRFKGKLKLSDEARTKMHFPSGTYIGEMATILKGETDVTHLNAYVRTGAFDSYRTSYFARDRRLSTWPTTDSHPTSTFSVVPTSKGSALAVVASDVCTTENVVVDGTLYGAYPPPATTSSPQLAYACTCVNSQIGTPTQYCMQLSNSITI